MAHTWSSVAASSGLATAHQLTQDHPHATVTVLEKEDRVAGHQTGHNSGVIHAGVYYKPGSLKARAVPGRLARRWWSSASSHDIPYRICGKLIVATDPAELPRLDALYERATANGLPVTHGHPGAGPRVRAATSPASPRCTSPRPASSTSARSAATLADLVEKAGGTVRLGARVTGAAARRATRSS